MTSQTRALAASREANQALELGSRFSSGESLPFLNGVLDAVNQKIRG